MWKDVVGWEGVYEVSDKGQVRKYKGIIIGQWISDGYPQVRLSKPRMNMDVHRIVALAFIPKIEGKNVVNHIDFITHNNNVENLEWCTQAENIKHSRDAGRYPDCYWKGKRSPNAKLDDVTVMAIRHEYAQSGTPYSKLAKKYNSSKRTVGRIINNETYKM